MMAESSLWHIILTRSGVSTAVRHEIQVDGPSRRAVHPSPKELHFDRSSIVASFCKIPNAPQLAMLYN